MPELLDPPAAAPPDADTETTPPRTMEEIRAESQALGARVRDPDTPAAEKLAARLRLLALMDEMRKHWTEEDDDKYYEVLRGIDSHRPPGQKLFEHAFAEERS